AHLEAGRDMDLLLRFLGCERGSGRGQLVRGNLFAGRLAGVDGEAQWLRAVGLIRGGESRESKRQSGREEGRSFHMCCPRMARPGRRSKPDFSNSVKFSCHKAIKLSNLLVTPWRAPTNYFF